MPAANEGVPEGKGSMEANMAQAIAELDRQWASHSPHEPDFEVFRALRHGRDGVFVDVGANAGQSALSFKTVAPQAQVVSFEPNRMYAPCLAHAQRLLDGNSFSFHLVGCGDQDSRSELIVPVIDGRPYLQEASLDPAQFEVSWVKARFATYGSHVSFERVPVEIRRLDDFHLRPVAVKIDAEGWEMGVLRGMVETLEASLPMLLIENNDYMNVTPFLAARGYAPYMFDGRHVIPLHGLTANTLYLTGEHFAWLSPALLP